ncbi:MAG: BatD family protein [Pseudomonadales bacterium]|nr:BatD family protein [Pseudomonadales bacterium]
MNRSRIQLRLSLQTTIAGIFIFIATLTSSHSVVAEGFVASVNRNNIELNESFELTLSIDEQIFIGEPDLTQVAENFTVLGKRRSSQYRSVNGETLSSTDWVISLKPKKTGYLVIPPIDFKGQQSKAIAIEVSKVQSSKANSNSKLFFETDVDRNKVYQQAQLLYKVKLYTAINISRANITEPKLDQAIIHSLGDQLIYEAVRNGIRYQVHEWNYAIFPQQQGTLTIPAPVLSASISDRSSMYGRPISITTEDLSIEVTPTPANYPAQPWIATPSLKATQHWDPAHTNIKVGDSITRTIEFDITDNEIALIPELEHPELTNVKTYPDKPQSENSQTNAGIQGQRIEKIAYVVTKPGAITIPAFEISWWNTQTEQLETTKLPARTFEVAAVDVTESPTDITATTSPAMVADTKAVKNPNGKHSQPFANQSDQFIFWWMLSSAALCVLLLLITTLWWRARSQLRRIQQRLDGGLDHLDGSPGSRQFDEKQAFTTLKNICVDQPATEIWKGLIIWAQHYWQTPAIHSSDDITCRLPAESELIPIIRKLDAALFSPSAQPFIESDQLVTLLKAQRAIKHKPINPAAVHSLKPLYPQ